MKFLRKEKSQAGTYLELIDNLKLKESNSISSNIVRLNKLKGYFTAYNVADLQIIRTEVSSLVEDYKQNSLFASMITIMLAVFTFAFTIVKELFGLYKLTGLLSPILILLIGYVLIQILLMFKSFSRSSKSLNQLLSIIDLIIEERRNIDILHQEAYKDFLNEDS
ncbi:hypothetical protein M3647_01510 [Paenibacillus cellulositrophicus]|uniref:hypothetical protein n=1 Tax=Paenibacillus cellulositrophicus TaxID=562959 RepID=UPI00203C11D2|nr:hypothetical protein [Paenibacillus cellulositrophicus]MCM2996144.1 hypothetical protein [Paenibacillus cellulositrophicus]